MLTDKDLDDIEVTFMDITRALSQDRAIKAVTGMSIAEFKSLAEKFERVYEMKRIKVYEEEVMSGKRKRQLGGGRKGKLDNTYKRLFFILFYLKCYPTFDLLALLFGMHRANSYRNVQKLLPVIRETLEGEMVLPKRKIRSLEELFEIYPESEEIFIDAVERSIQRPKDKKKQREFYSGKKKRHTQKNTIITNKKRRILYLGPTVEGKKHDYKAFKEEFSSSTLSAGLLEAFSVYADLGYLGIEKEYPLLKIKMPKKKPKGKELTLQERMENRKISSVRIKVEHAISGIKRFGIIWGVLRNRKEGFGDKVMEIACGLWNYHLSKAN